MGASKRGKYLCWLCALALPVCVRTYSTTDPAADHTAAAIDFAEEGEMERAILSFRAAATFAPAVPEHWHNLGTALRDEGYAVWVTCLAQGAAALDAPDLHVLPTH